MAVTHTSGAPALTFTFSAKTLRCILRDGEPWFVAADVCEALALDDTSKACSRLDDDEKGTNSIRTPSGDQQMLVINESGLYSLILTSRKPEAKKFKKWVTSEVLPAIRKTGRYVVPELARGEYLGGKDLQHIRRLIWFAVNRFRQADVWTQAVWFYLRRALNVPSPHPWAVSDLPRLAIELQHVNTATFRIGELIQEIEREAVRRIFRKGEDADTVIQALRQGALKRLASEQQERARMPSHLQGDVNDLLSRDSRTTNIQYVDDENPHFFSGSASAPSGDAAEAPKRSGAQPATAICR